MNKKWIAIIGSAAGVLAVGVLLGCQKPQIVAAQTTDAARTATPPAPAAGAGSGGTHADTKPHAPNVQSFADYHVEAQVSRSGKVELFFYGGKPGELRPIDSLLGDVMDARVIVPGEDAIPVYLSAKPFPSDGDGQSSHFVGTFDTAKLRGEQMALSLSLPFEGRTYRIQWSPSSLAMADSGSSHLGNSDASMPAAVTDTEAQKLFGTPGGLYTKADIAANGNTTAALKFAGMMAKHNMNPAKGGKICPVTNTAADARFAWVIGGKTYRFCCPPCVEEFVRQAKEKPDSVKPPDFYVKRK